MNDYDELLADALKECVTYWEGYLGEARTTDQLIATAKIMVERNQVFPETFAIYRKFWDWHIKDQADRDPLKGVTVAEDAR